jgi:hypothetical protein
MDPFSPQHFHAGCRMGSTQAVLASGERPIGNEDILCDPFADCLPAPALLEVTAMRDWFSRLWREERGSQLLEFIFTFPLVWMLIVFSFDQFTILYNKQKALSAAYEAGRIAAVQPTFSLARYHAEKRGEEELEGGIGVIGAHVHIFLKEGRWRKGNHIESVATISFRLLASGEPLELTESYFMMIENAEDGKEWGSLVK